MAQKPLTYKQKAGISFIEQDDPPFIKEMKKKMGFKEPPKLEDKFEEPGPADIDDPEAELLRMKEEDREFCFEEKSNISARKIAEGKITFKKPTKRTTQVDESDEVEEKRKKDEVKQPETRLLSFGNDEEEDE
ncbi:unnamed protein product [Angiostrongylus costaricensis]|uniref:DUF4604 domain-containing protein n=1 Tax=Angiostrongylus costaricensis TaxID=334426 RepID=A0A0R3PPN4_ANGCS|nr:unnamed protein product [Angiostrongylus costaricensis]